MRILEATNPLIPTGYDIAWSIVALMLIAFVVSAIVSLVRASGALTGIQTFVWFVIILALPVFGAVAWFVAGHPRTRKQPVA
ncbi:hypothetical protein ACQ143_04690 [Microbacterium sp. MC2]